MSPQDDPTTTPAPPEEHTMEITDGPDRPTKGRVTDPDAPQETGTPAGALADAQADAPADTAPAHDDDRDEAATTPLPAVDATTPPPAADATTPLPGADAHPADDRLARDAAATQRLDVLAGLGDAGRIHDDPEPPPTWSAATAPAAETSSAPRGAAAPEPTAPAPEPPRGVRVGTVVWGLVIAAVGVGLIAWASGVVFDVELAVIGLVAAAGAALLIGSLVSPRRRRP